MFIFDRIHSRLMSGKKSDTGPIGANVTATIRRFREERRLTYAELSRQLSGMGREIPPLGLRRIESGDRKVDVDDLVALALALEVSPLALLLPTETNCLVPQGDKYTAERIWEWARGGKALTKENAFRFVRDSNPLMDWSGVEERLALGETVIMSPRTSESSNGDD